MTEVKVIQLANWARSFATRSKGQEMSQRFGEVIQDATAKTIVMGRDRISAASPSFVDEFVSGIQKRFNNRSCLRRMGVFTGDHDYIVEMLDVILRRRGFPVQHALRADEVEKGTCGFLGNSTEPRPVPA